MIPLLAAAVIAVTPATFVSATATATAGDVAKLAPGEYAWTYFRPGTIKPGVTIDASDPGAHLAGMRFDAANGVTILKPTLIGTNDPMHPEMGSIALFRSQNIQVTGWNCLRASSVCVNVIFSQHVKVLDGWAHEGGGDGIQVRGSSDVEIARNTCSDALPLPGAHPDCVQVYSAAIDAPLADIYVHDNTATGPIAGFNNYGNMLPMTNMRFEHNKASVSLTAGVLLDYKNCAPDAGCTVIGNTVRTLPAARWPAVILPGPRTPLPGWPAGSTSGNSVRP